MSYSLPFSFSSPTFYFGKIRGAIFLHWRGVEEGKIFANIFLLLFQGSTWAKLPPFVVHRRKAKLQRPEMQTFLRGDN